MPALYPELWPSFDSFASVLLEPDVSWIITLHPFANPHISAIEPVSAIRKFAPVPMWTEERIRELERKGN